MSNITGGKLVYKKLLSNGINTVFGYTGGAIMPVFDSLYNQDKINLYLPPHEAFVGFQAIGYAKSNPTNLGVGIVTSGPGILNCVTPLLDAQNDSTPFLLLSGNAPIKSKTRAFQSCDAVSVTKSLTKWSYQVKDISELSEVLDYGINLALNGKKGAVHIDLPKCVLLSEIKYKDYYYPQSLKNYNFIYNTYPSTLKKIDTKNKFININKEEGDYKYKKLLDLIKICKRPIIIAGNGVNNSYNKLRKFVDKTNIPITTTIHAMGSYPEDNKLSLGFHGMHGIPSSNIAIQKSDLIINLGGRFCDRTTGPNFGYNALEAWKNNKGGIVHINIDKKEFNISVESNVNINQDCNIFFDKILPKLEDKYDRTNWLNEINNLKKKYPLIHNIQDKPVTQDLIIELNKQIKKNKDKDYNITADVGNIIMISSQYINFNNPRQFISSGSVGAMGSALSYAIGSGLYYKNNKKKQIICIVGDGGFEMSLPDLKSINRYNLDNIKILVCNNKNLSMVNCWEKIFFDSNEIACDNSDAPLYDKISENYGIKSFYVNNHKDLTYKINLWLKYPGSSLLHADIDKSFCFPLVSPGNSIDNMILSENDFKKKIDKRTEVPS